MQFILVQHLSDHIAWYYCIDTWQWQYVRSSFCSTALDGVRPIVWFVHSYINLPPTWKRSVCVNYAVLTAGCPCGTRWSWIEASRRWTTVDELYPTDSVDWHTDIVSGDSDLQRAQPLTGNIGPLNTRTSRAEFTVPAAFCCSIRSPAQSVLFA